MSWIRIKNITKSYDKQMVLREVDFKLSKGDRVGIIGANGTGKSTILKLILDQESPDTGSIDITDDVTIGYFSQFSELVGELSVLEVLDATFTEVHQTEKALTDIADALGASPDMDEMSRLLDEQAELFETMERIDGWSYENKMDTVLSKLGFSEDRRLRPIDQLSGGWRNRAALAKILLESPDVLLMDEPTNFLDVAGLKWLEGWLSKFGGAVIVVSHDRDFLDAVVTTVVEVENHKLQVYPGNYSDYVPKKHFRLKSLEREFVHEQELLAYEDATIKSRKASLSDKRARTDNKQLNRKLANIKKSTKRGPVDQIVTDIYAELHVSRELCEVRDLTKSYGDEHLFSGLTFELRSRDRLAIVGPNGCGKSTLLAVLGGSVRPDSGEVRWRGGSKANNANYVSYNEIFDNLDLSDTVSHAVNSAPDSLAFSATKKSVNRFLSLFQFSEMDLKQRLGDLSGGQRARVALVMCLLSGAPVIILDEPTNHLDIGSAQVMERALSHFPGAVVVVSHDRFFIDKIASKVLTFDGDGGVG